MSLTKLLRESVSKSIESIDYKDLNEYAIENKEILKELYKEEIIDDELIEKSLDKVVRKQARIYFNLMTNHEHSFKEYHADDFPHTKVLSYAIKNEEFSQEEIKQIPIDHGYNVKEFIERYNSSNLLKDLRIQILNPRKRVIVKYVEHPI